MSKVAIKRILSGEKGSLKIRISASVTPAVPMPTNTLYAIPISSTLTARIIEIKEIKIPMPVRVKANKLSLYFSPLAQKHSTMPPKITNPHAKFGVSFMFFIGFPYYECVFYGLRFYSKPKVRMR